MKENVVPALKNHSVNDGRWTQSHVQKLNSSLSTTEKLLEEFEKDSGEGRSLLYGT